MNNTRPLDAREQAELDARLRDQALARAQARLDGQAVQPTPPPQQVRAPVHPQAPSQVYPPVQAHSPAMVVPPVAPTASDSLDFIGGERDVNDFIRANRHSGRVKVLRVALPLMAVFILSLVLGAYFWSQSGAPSVSVQTAAIENGRMVMKNPEINGVDERQRPYNLVAREAITDPAVPSQVELVGIDANIPLDDGVFAKIIAGTGFYDSEAKTLQLVENIDIRTEEGVMMSLKDADVNIDNGTLLTSNPVSILTEQAKISADTFSVENNGERVIFESRVRMTIYPEKFDNAGASD